MSTATLPGNVLTAFRLIGHQTHDFRNRHRTRPSGVLCTTGFHNCARFQRGRHPMTVFWTAFFHIGHICIAIYVAVGLALALMLTSPALRGSAAHQLHSFWNNDGNRCLGCHVVPGSLWTMLIPCPITGVAARDFLVYTYTSSAQSRSQKLLF